MIYTHFIWFLNYYLNFKDLRIFRPSQNRPLQKMRGYEKHRFLGVKSPSNNTACVFFAKKEAKKGVSMGNRPNTSTFGQKYPHFGHFGPFFDPFLIQARGLCLVSILDPPFFGDPKILKYPRFWPLFRGGIKSLKTPKNGYFWVINHLFL